MLTPSLHQKCTPVVTVSPVLHIVEFCNLSILHYTTLHELLCMIGLSAQGSV